MNNAELNALKTPLTNLARVLYCLVLRPGAHPKVGTTEALNYKDIIALLNTEDSDIHLGRQINSLISELQKAGLVTVPADVDINKSLNKKSVVLPLLTIKDDRYTQLHQTKTAMTASWQADEELFTELAQLVGLIDKLFSAEETGDFVAYWLGRPESLFTQFQWTQKFVSHLKQKRLAKNMVPVKKIGTQLTKAKSGIEADDNARKLVEKYSTKQ